MEVWKRKAAGKSEQQDRRGEGRDGNEGLGRWAVCGRCPGGRLVSLDEVRGQPSEVTLSDKQGPSSLWSEDCHPFGPSIVGNPQTLTPLFPSPSILLISFIRWRGCLELEDISRLSETAAWENWYQARVPEPTLLSQHSLSRMPNPLELCRWNESSFLPIEVGPEERGSKIPEIGIAVGWQSHMGVCYPKRTLPAAQTAGQGTCSQVQVTGHRGPPDSHTHPWDSQTWGCEARHSEPALSPQVLIDFPYTEHVQMVRFSPRPGAAHGVSAHHISVSAYGQLLSC